ncbi:hypothetical protein SEA_CALLINALLBARBZ_39 [Arthrobacter phage CallinAllBarbz]|uniref:Uncharacterized protein n=1 Tax=Arthrobacter phage CallinAllBarbz TaxID=3077790 RepID=A0AA96HDW9_9CAUD|nr:hypothetical protein SEA_CALLINALLBARBZ_39 [Arthrobacter phage CallinAllBarbz]
MEYKTHHAAPAEEIVTVGALNEAAGLLELDDLDLENLRKVIRIARRLDAGA